MLIFINKGFNPKPAIISLLSVEWTTIRTVVIAISNLFLICKLLKHAFSNRNSDFFND